MNVLVTGATGFIGKRLIQKLAQGGFQVIAIYRNISKTQGLEHANITWVKGDITKAEHIDKIVSRCDIIFHLAAYAKVWAPKRDTYRQINVQGTKNILESAIRHKIKKVIVTSTAGIFGPSRVGIAINETSIRTVNFFSEYEKTKYESDQLIINTYSKQIPICMVCPTRVFGPGELSESNSVTKLIDLYIRGKFRLLPGNGKSVGNYVYVDDVVDGMLLALAHGKNGEQYILGGENLSYQKLFSYIAKISGKKYNMIKTPVWLILGIAACMKLISAFQIRPTLTPGWARKYMYNWEVSSQKAINELGYKPTSVKLALRKTLVWLLSEQQNTKKPMVDK